MCADGQLVGAVEILLSVMHVSYCSRVKIALAARHVATVRVVGQANYDKSLHGYSVCLYLAEVGSGYRAEFQ